MPQFGLSSGHRPCISLEDVQELMAAFYAESGLWGILGGFFWLICLEPSPALVVALVLCGFCARLNEGFPKSFQCSLAML